VIGDDAKFVCFLINLQAMSSGEANGYGGADDAHMAEIGNAADFSYAFSTTTGFKVRQSLLMTNIKVSLTVPTNLAVHYPVLAVSLGWSCFERLHANAVPPGSRQADAKKTGE